MSLFIKVAVVVCGLICAAASATSRPKSIVNSGKCTLSTTERKNNGFVRYTLNKYECRDVTPHGFSEVTCDKKCRNPVTDKFLPLKYFKSEPITLFEKFVRRDGKVMYHRLSVSCRCTATALGLRLRKRAMKSGGV